MLIVQKYGGSSVADAERIRRVARRVVKARRENNEVVVVVSAMGDATDELIELAAQITDSPPDREMDMLLSTGEQVSIALLAMAIRSQGENVVSLTGPQAGIVTTDVHTKARIKEIKTKRLKKELLSGNIAVLAGFQGINTKGDITTLGRGGSDTTAVAVAAALNADLCEIYTDVDGVFTTDPRVVPEARKLSEISYDEMLELAHLGAGVLIPRAVECAKLYGIPLHVRSSFHEQPGTIVKEAGQMEKSLFVTGVAHDTDVVKIGIFEVDDRPGIAWQIFKALSDENISVDMIIQSATRDEVNHISFTVSRNDLKKSLVVLGNIQSKVGAKGFAYDDNVAKVSIVGAGMVGNPGVASMMFEALAKEGINIEMISTSEIKISCVVKEEYVEKAVRALHKKFNLGTE